MKMVEIQLRGHLTDDSLRAAFLAVEPELEPQSGQYLVLIDCLEMHGYSLSARATFVEWNYNNKSRVLRVAIATSNSVWLMVISAMGLASGQRMRGFASRDLAKEWLVQH